jgi:hypothetical protein
MSAVTLDEALSYLEQLSGHEVLVIVESPGRGGVPVRLAGKLRALGRLGEGIGAELTGMAFTVGDAGLVTVNPKTFMSAEIGSGGRLLRVMDLGGVALSIELHDERG